MIQFPYIEIIQRIGQDNYPPLYFLILKGWAGVFGDSAFALRSLSVVFGMLAILGVYFFAVEAFGSAPSDTAAEERTRGRGTGLLAAAFVALSAFQVRYSQEVRMYALAGVLAVFSSWALLRALRPPSRRRRWLVYGFLTLLLAYTHYYALFTLAAHAVFLIGFLLVGADWRLAAVCRDPRFRHAVLIAVFVTACWLPWLPSFLRQRAQVQDAFWTPPVDRWIVALTSYQLLIAPQQGDNTPVPRSLQLLVADLCVLGLWLLRRWARAGEWFVLSAILVPLLLAVLVAVFDTRVVGAPRYFAMMQPFLLVGLAALVWRLPLLERAILVILLLAGALWLYIDFWKTADIAHKPGARAAAEYINARRGPGEPVIVSTPFFFFSMLHYAEHRAGHYLYWDGKPILHHLGKPALIPGDLITDDRLRSFSSRRIWLVDMAGSSWLGWRMGSVPTEWMEKSRTAFPEAFCPWNAIVVEYEIKRPDQKQLVEDGH